MSDLALFGSTTRSPHLRHEIPVEIIDPLLFCRTQQKPYVLTYRIEAARVRDVVPDAELSRGPTLVAGDVVAIEPGLWDARVGSARLEDLVLVTEDGCENLTQFPYGLDPGGGSRAS